MNPTARTEEILVDHLLDETLVYDLGRHRAHLLNRTAATIWRRCDGRTTIEEMTASLPELGLPADPTMVHYALSQLERVHLLEEPVTATTVPRREMLRKLAKAGAVALLLPAVTSIAAPTPAMAASPKCAKRGQHCGTPTGDCKTGRPPCCANQGLCNQSAGFGCICQ